MKKILYNLQLSAIKDGKFLLDKDSNFRVINNTIKAFNKYCEGQYEHYVLIPHNLTGDIATCNDIKYIYCDNYTTKVFSSRYNWHVEEMNKLLLEIQPDIIWENNPTLVNNWKTLLLENKLIDKIKVISYIHWIDSENYPKIDRRTPYLIRQFEGHILSDMVLCNSNEAISQIKEQFKEMHYRQYNDAKIFKFPPLINEDEFKNIVSKSDDVIKIIYNHRLSNMSYYDEPFKLFLKILNRMKQIKTGKRINIILTDASGKIKYREDIDFKDSNNIKLILKNNMDRIDYLNELKSCHICIGLFQKEFGGCWSISLAESIMSGCAVVMPNYSGYGEMIPKNCAGIIDNNINRTIDLLEQLTNFKDLRNFNSKEKIKFYKKNYNSKKLILELNRRIKEMYKCK
jgi:glycosyltransferase involved in cell wall biosynthesis